VVVTAAAASAGPTSTNYKGDKDGRSDG